jgi:hypothetical protein
LGAHLAQLPFEAEPDALEVHGNDPVEVNLLHVDQGGLMLDPCVVESEIDSAECLDRCGDQRLLVLLGRDIGGHEDRSATFLLDEADGFQSFVAAALEVRDDHTRPCGRVFESADPADPASATSDQAGPTRERTGHLNPSRNWTSSTRLPSGSAA